MKRSGEGVERIVYAGISAKAGAIGGSASRTAPGPVRCGVWSSSVINPRFQVASLTRVGQMILLETLFALIDGFPWEQRWPS